MSRPRAKNASPSRPKSKRAPYGSQAAKRTAKRARSLIEAMLQEMELGLVDPHYRMTDEWERLFGAKQSMVVNLQKLVAALAAVPNYELPKAVPEEQAEARDAPITPAEMEMLKAWISEGNEPLAAD